MGQASFAGIAFRVDCVGSDILSLEVGERRIFDVCGGR